MRLHTRVIAALAGTAACTAIHAETALPHLSDEALAFGGVRVEAAWVELGENGQPIARAIVQPSARPNPCPLLVTDSRGLQRMDLRANAATVPQRPTVSDPADSKPSDFPVAVCEAALPARTRLAFVGRHWLPLPKANPRRILILGDTGCRLQKSSNIWQECSNPTAWPFASITNVAARFAPDLVVHVGDYHYRENACPPDVAGCQGSPWGYGWDTWKADFFEPARRLLTAAPWVVVRGNHEACARGGQGWFRFLDPRPYQADRTCDNPANDAQANASEPYAVPIGSDTQLILFDSAKAGYVPLQPTDPQFQTYQSQFRTVANLAAKPGVMSIFVDHHPILAFAPLTGGTPAPGTAGLLSVMTTLNGTAYYPPGVQLALHGHVHDFQAINFATPHPAAIVSGNAGDSLDVAFPDPFPASASPAPGVTVSTISHNNAFGFMFMERQPAPATGWLYKAYTAAGKLLTTCTQNGNTLACDKTGFVAP